MNKIALCTPEDIRGITAVTASDYTFDDPILQNCILMASATIIRYLGRPVKQQEVVDTFVVPRSFVGNFKLYPSAGPIAADSLSVSVNGEEDNDAVSPYGLSAYMFAATPAIEDTTVVMTYTGGWPTRTQTDWPDVEVLDAPQDVVQACAMQASDMANAFLKNSNAKEKNNTKQAHHLAISPQVSFLLAPYRRSPYMGV